MRECFPIHLIDSMLVTKFELPKVEDLKLMAIDFDSNCSYLDGNDNYIRKCLRHCLRIVQYIEFTKDK